MSSASRPRSLRPAALRRAAALLGLAALGGCAAGDSGRVRAGEPGGPPDRPALTAELLEVEPVTFRREHGSCRREGADSASVPCVTVTIAYPEILGAVTPALADSARAFVRSVTLAAGMEDTTPAADAAGAAASLIAEYEEIEAYLDGVVEIWTLEREVRVRCQSPRVASLDAREWRYTGGAHGLQVERLTSLDARTGRRLTLSDLVTDTAAVTAIAERAFREQQQIPATQSLAQAGYIFFEDERFALNGNFALCGDTLAFHYDPYEIAPYALGPTDFTLPLAAIREYLRPEWRE